MIFNEDTTEQGRKCQIINKGETIDCTVVCVFERKSKNNITTRKYRLQSKDKVIYDNILISDIKFND